MKKAILVLSLLVASNCFAQSTVKVQLTDGTRKWYQELPVAHKTADRVFWLDTALSVGMTVADVENSMYALNKPGTSEANWLFGSRPTRARYYGITMPVTVLSAYLSWRYKREDDALTVAGLPGHKYSKWWLPNLLNTAGHTLGVGVTLASTGR